ncbi:IS630 family transposase [Methylocaldum gracile]|nr:IS630 family transposase [Methylocaldum sp. BRCS4]
MAKKYRVTLTPEERQELEGLIGKGKGEARKLAHARILLQAEEAEGGPKRTDAEVASVLNVSVRTVERVRERFVEQGFEAALAPKPSERVYTRLLDGAQEAQLIALACSAPPLGKTHWTLRLLAERVVELEIAETCSHETVRRVLKKNELQPHRRKMWVIPPEASAEFVAHMEEVLEVYQRPYQPERPVVCLDETFTQLMGEVREPLPPAPGQVERYDSVYVRNGVASLFLAFEPLAGWREVQITEGRTRKDFAQVVRDLVDGRYREADKVVLVMDQLNTHSTASLYEAFAPEEARRIAERLEIHHTPKHGSWLDMAEIELSALARDLPERVGERADLEQHLKAWTERRNQTQVKAQWQFTTKEARIKLRKLYPTYDG